MTNYHRIAHDHCWSSVAVMEEIPEFRAQCYEALWAMLEHYEMTIDLQARRLRPCEN